MVSFIQKLDKPTFDKGGFMVASHETEKRYDLPYIEVCNECGKHGRIIIPSQGYVCSTELVTQDNAIQWSTGAVKIGIMDGGELMEVIRQIKLSSLPPENPDIVVKDCNTYHSWSFNDMLSEVKTKIPAHYHDGTDARN